MHKGILFILKQPRRLASPSTMQEAQLRVMCDVRFLGISDGAGDFPMNSLLTLCGPTDCDSICSAHDLRS